MILYYDPDDGWQDVRRLEEEEDRLWEEMCVRDRQLEMAERERESEEAA